MLSDGKRALIIDLLKTYAFYCDFLYKNREKKELIFEGQSYIIGATDYEKVCKIIDFIKEVKEDVGSL